MTDVDDRNPAARLADAYALWSQSKGTRSDQWIELLAESIEMRSVLTPDLPDDLAANAAPSPARSNISRRWRAIGR